MPEFIAAACFLAGAAFDAAGQALLPRFAGGVVCAGRRHAGCARAGDGQRFAARAADDSAEGCGSEQAAAAGQYELDWLAAAEGCARSERRASQGRALGRSIRLRAQSVPSRAAGDKQGGARRRPIEQPVNRSGPVETGANP